MTFFNELYTYFYSIIDKYDASMVSSALPIRKHVGEIAPMSQNPLEAVSAENAPDFTDKGNFYENNFGTDF